jgi:hypothetical protein
MILYKWTTAMNEVDSNQLRMNDEYPYQLVYHIDLVENCRLRRKDFQLYQEF